MAKKLISGGVVMLIGALIYVSAEGQQAPVKEALKTKPAAKAKTDPAKITLHLKIADADGTLSVTAEKQLPGGTKGFVTGRWASLRLFGCSVVASILFYATTNGAVWVFGMWYPRDWDGLLTCLVAGLSFLKMTLAGDLSWSFGLFGVYAACRFIAGVRWPETSHVVCRRNLQGFMDHIIWRSCNWRRRWVAS